MGYLDGYIYHMLHFENLRSVLQIGALLCNEILERRGIIPHSIANDEVQALRSRIFIHDNPTQQYHNLHYYVPFYFATRPPMLHRKYIEGIQDKIIILEVSRSILTKGSVVFTNGNASIQRLSKFMGERVGIIPASKFNNGICYREYRPNGPHGTNQSCSDIFSDVSFLDRLDWDGINNRRYIEGTDEYIRIRSAEVLVPNSLPLNQIHNIFVSKLDMVQTVNKLIASYGLTQNIPGATYKPEMFF